MFEFNEIIIWLEDNPQWIGLGIIGASFIESFALIGIIIPGVVLLALISGAIWGQPTWGTWWVWDARLTSTLVLLLFYLAIIGLYSSFDNKKSADQAVSILAMV